MARRRRPIRRDPLFDGEEIEPRMADLGLCAHGIPEDDDCLDCRTHGCQGGSDCDCNRRRARDSWRLEADA